MPTTKVGMPAVAADMTAAIAAGESSICWLPPPIGQLGWPSVAITMNLGFVSCTPLRQEPAPASAARVGVQLPFITLPMASVRPAMAVMSAAALFAAMGAA